MIEVRRISCAVLATGMLTVSSTSALAPGSAGPAGLAEAPSAVSLPTLPDSVSSGNRSMHFIAASTTAGPTPFQFPFELTFDQGYFFVSDLGNNVVQMFQAPFTFVRSFGVAGAGSSAAGSFNGPEQAAVVGASIYVADFGNSRVQRFDKNTGAYISQFGSAGSGDGQFGDPTGVAYNPVNNLLYVCDVNAPGGVQRVQVFDLSGIFQFAFGSAGSGDGQLGIAYALAVDRAGNIYVADYGNSRIDKFNKDGGWIRNFATGIPSLTVAVDPAADTLWLASTNQHVYNYDVLGNYLGSYNGSGSPSFHDGFFKDLHAVAVTTPAALNGTAAIIITDGSGANLQFYTHSSQPLVHPAFDTTTISGGGLDGGAIQIAHDQSENVYVSSSGQNLVYKYDKFGNFITSWGNAGAGRLNFPRGIALSPDGSKVYVADDSDLRVVITDNNGVYLGAFGSAGTSNGQFEGLAGVTVDKFGYIYVVDPVRDIVEEFTPAAAFYTNIGTGAGTGNGQFQDPTGVAVDSERGQVYVSEFVGARIQQFDWFGTFIRVYSSSTSGPGMLSNPFGLAIDDQGNLYCADRTTQQVLQFSDTDTYLASFPFTNANAVDVDPHNGQIHGGSTDGKVVRIGATLGKFAGLGYYRPSTQTFVLSRALGTTLTPDITAKVAGAQKTDIPLTGDWNGDGIDTPALYRPSTSTFYFWDRWVKLDVAAPDYTFTFGGISATDRPLAGDWNADGSSGLSIYQVAAHQFNLKNTINGSGSDYQVVFGVAGDLPVVGDWDGDGVTTPGVFRPSDASFHISNRNVTGVVSDEGSFPLGRIGDLPFAGDWQSNGFSGLGVFRRGTGHFYLKYTLDSAPADVDATFDPGKIFGDSFDATGDYPVAGYWGYPSE